MNPAESSDMAGAEVIEAEGLIVRERREPGITCTCAEQRAGTDAEQRGGAHEEEAALRQADHLRQQYEQEHGQRGCRADAAADPIQPRLTVGRIVEAR